MVRFTFILSLFLCIFVSYSIVYAVPVKYYAQGEIPETSDFLAGSTVSLTMTVDSTKDVYYEFYNPDWELYGYYWIPDQCNIFIDDELYTIPVTPINGGPQIYLSTATDLPPSAPAMMDHVAMTAPIWDLLSYEGPDLYDETINLGFSLFLPGGTFGDIPLTPMSGTAALLDDAIWDTHASMTSIPNLTQDIEFTSFKVSPVPEPATIFLLGAGLVGLAGFGRKRFKN